MIDAKISDCSCWKWLVQDWPTHQRNTATFSNFPQVFDSWFPGRHKMSLDLVCIRMFWLCPWQLEVRVTVKPWGVPFLISYLVSQFQRSYGFCHIFVHFQFIGSSDLRPVSKLQSCPQLAEPHDLTIVQCKEHTRGGPRASSHVGLWLMEAAPGVSSWLCSVLLKLKTSLLLL